MTLGHCGPSTLSKLWSAPSVPSHVAMLRYICIHMHTYALHPKISQTSALIKNLDSKHFPREHGLVKPVQPHEQHGFLQLGSGPQTALPRAWLRFWLPMVPLPLCVCFHVTFLDSPTQVSGIVGIVFWGAVPLNQWLPFHHSCRGYTQLKEVITIVTP